MAPSNDVCSSAIVIPGAGPFPYLTPVVDISGATTNGDPFLPSSCQGNTNVTRSVWFKFTPSVTARYTLSLGPDTATDFGDGNNDTVLAIYSAPSGCGGPFNLLLCDDDSSSYKYPLLTALSTNFTGGTTYYIVAWAGQISANAGQAQPMNLQLRVTKPAAPANDNCSTTEMIPPSGPFPYLTTATDTTLATDAPNELTSPCAYSRGVWYSFTPSASGTYIFSSDIDSGTTVGDTAMALFSGSCGALTEIICTNKEIGVPFRATITNTISAGTTRYILVWDAEPTPIFGETMVQLRVGMAGKPTVTTLAASAITGGASVSAALNMTINANGYASRYFFEWGPTTSYGNMTPSRSLTSPLTLPQSRPETIAGFTPGVTYHYRAVGSNVIGKVFGLDRTFVASTNAPVLNLPVALANGNFRFQFNGNIGQVYTIQGSANLASSANWVDLGNATDLGTGVFEFIHTPGSSPPYRFYKARVR